LEREISGTPQLCLVLLCQTLYGGNDIGFRLPRSLKILIIAEAANPDWVSVPLIGWSLSKAIAAQVDVHLVTQIRNRTAIEKNGTFGASEITYIDSELVAKPLFRMANFLTGGKGKGWTLITALSSLSYYWFEHLIIMILGDRIRRQEFDIVHRVTPLSPTAPSLLASFCKKSDVPFVLGPLNGGVPWPKQFLAERVAEREWLSFVRGAYRLLPFYRSTLRNAAVILSGSHHTLDQLPEKYKGKCVYLPENGIETSVFKARPASQPCSGTLSVCFVGRLVPYKGADMLIEAMRPLLASGAARLQIVGDGPQRVRLEGLISSFSLQSSIDMLGWCTPEAVAKILHHSDVMCFPSIREFGGGVVLEAMASGAVPIVIDYAGPGELVDDVVGWAVPLGSRTQIINLLSKILSRISEDPNCLREKQAAGLKRIEEMYTWKQKAFQIVEVYRWVLGECPERPTFKFSNTRP
jgi:glycosyltransferase involved in cell wall biosynthesis